MRERTRDAKHRKGRDDSPAGELGVSNHYGEAWSLRICKQKCLWVNAISRTSSYFYHGGRPIRVGWDSDWIVFLSQNRQSSNSISSKCREYSILFNSSRITATTQQPVKSRQQSRRPGTSPVTEPQVWLHEAAVSITSSRSWSWLDCNYWLTPNEWSSPVTIATDSIQN